MTKRALLIGINYINSNAELQGCMNDIENIYKLLLNKYQYKSENVMLMTDKTKIKPTKNNIIKYLTQLIQNSNADNTTDTLYFHYSGHGTNILDTMDQDEIDNFDECLVPIDYAKNGLIVDDVIRKIVKQLNPAKKIIMIVDACNSGSIVDLKYEVDCQSVQHSVSLDDENNTENNNENNTENNTENNDDQSQQNEDDYLYHDWTYDFQLSQYNNYSTNANIFSLSGCRDDQLSADAYINNKFQGALTHCFIKVLTQNNYVIKLKYLLKDIHCMLQILGYSQKPVIQTSKPIQLDSLFTL